MTGGSLYYSPKKVRQIIVACCMLHNLAVRRQVPFLQEDGPEEGLVAAVEPVDSEEEEAEEEDIDNRNSSHTSSKTQGPFAGWFSFCRGWGAGVVVLWRCLLSTSTGRGGGLFIIQASVRGPLLCHSVPPGVDKVLQHPYNGDQVGVDGLEFLPDPQILFLLQPLGLPKCGQYRCHRLLEMMVRSHDVGEGLVESGFPGPVLPLSHSSHPSSPVFLCLCPLNLGTANGIRRLKDSRVDSWVMIVWAYSYWRDSGGFVIASLSLTFGVADLCGCLAFGGFRAVGRNSCSGIPPPPRCVGGLLHGSKWDLQPVL
ncbi:hypothetical protein NDU88_003758 [Pleurodeles waltl]|uniref:Nuclease HARBI1 n=1 Tax=Pleurodeles waltl TaxID=8319 RepID=A0AAV7TPE2_PLEWA|nr:hypothetical protein NDU88_003758 [Pleurodeles waltl]